VRSIPIVSSLDLRSSALLYIVQEARVLVGYNKKVLVGYNKEVPIGLLDSNTTRITREKS
jgi:hypothetical protein